MSITGQPKWPLWRRNQWPLCVGMRSHGTAGNGYAFLKLFRRTGNPLWLDRARAFAIHAIAQSERHLEEFGLYRASLWTGDIGLAFYLRSCIQADGGFPTLDFF